MLAPRLLLPPPVQDSPNPPATVVAIDSGDEVTGKGITFNKRRVVVAATSHSFTEAPPSTYQEHPPSASSPHEPLAIEGGGESAPEGVPVPPAPELPSALQHALKRFQERRVAEERMGLSLRDILANSFAFAIQARLRAQEELEAKVREETEAKAKEELARQAQAFAHRETALTQELSCLRQTEKDLKKRIFDKGQAYTDLELKVLPLRTRVVELEEHTEVTKAKMAKLEERGISREVQLGQVEGDAELLEDVVDAYGGGFEDALAQIACVHPELNLTPFTALKRVVDGQLVPIAPPS